MTRKKLVDSDAVREAEICAIAHDGLQLILTRVQGRAYAVENRCAHLGWSMARGSVTGSTLRCPWHGSEYDVCSGKNLDWVNAFAGVPMPRWTHRLIALGKSPASIRSFETHEESGSIYVDIPD